MRRGSSVLRGWCIELFRLLLIAVGLPVQGAGFSELQGPKACRRSCPPRPLGSFLTLAATRHRPLQRARGWPTDCGYTSTPLISDARASLHCAPTPFQIRPVGRSAQRHQGGAHRAEDSRGAECHGGLILHKQQRTQRWRADLAHAVAHPATELNAPPA